MINNPDLSFSVEEFAKSLQFLENPIIAKGNPNKVLFSEAKDSGHFVAGELGVFRNDQDGSIWSLTSEADGNQYIVRQEDEAIREGRWSSLVNRTGDTITLAYDNAPIKKFAAEEYGFTKDNARLFAKVLVDRAIEQPAQFTKHLLASIPFQDRIALQTRFAAFRQE